MSGTRSKVTQLIKDVEVRDGDLSKQAGLAHHTDSLARVGTLGGFTRQHDTVRTIEHGVGNIRHLSTGGTRVVCHGLQHLSGANDGLALDVTLGDHHLLSDEHLGSGDLDTQVTTGDHDTVGLVKDLVKVVDTLLVLNLSNDLDLPTLLAKDIADVTNVATTTDERSKDHVDLVLNTELQVVDVLLGQSRKVDIGARQVDTLAGRNVTVVQTLATQGLLVYDFKDLEGKNTVIDIDQLAGGDHLGDVLIVQVPAESPLAASNLMHWVGNSHVLVITGIGIRFVRGDNELVAFLDRNILVVGGVSGTDLRSFLQRKSESVLRSDRKTYVGQTYGVKSDGKGTAGLGLLGLTGIVDHGLVVL